MNEMTAALRRYADFEGRSSRTEYWMFVLFQFLVSMALGIVAMVLTTAVAVGAQDDSGAGPAIVVGVLGLLALGVGAYLLVPSLAVAVRRLHDTGNSGWLLLLHLVPLGGFVIFVFTLLESSPGPNRYGPNPHGKGDAPVGASVFD